MHANSTLSPEFTAQHRTGIVGPGAVVVGGDYRGLGIVRSLGRKSIPVWVLSDHHRVAAYSRYATGAAMIPEGRDEDIVEFLCQHAERHFLHGWALFPTGDEMASIVARYASRLSEYYLLTTSPWEVIRTALDKRRAHELATAMRVDAPWTRWNLNLHDLSELEGRYPLILKPALRESENAFTFAKAWRVENEAELIDRFQEAAQYVKADTIMVQEIIPGDGAQQLSYAAVCIDGEPLASVVATRVRQHPIDFGRSSSYVESMADPIVEAAARRLIHAMGLLGFVEVEFKRDPRDGRAKLLDINPRVWGWHTLGEHGGVDFTHILWRALHGEVVTHQRVPPHTRWIRMVTDVAALMDQARHGKLSLGAYARSLFARPGFAMMAADDPIPALMEVPLLAGLSLNRRRAIAAGLLNVNQLPRPREELASR